ncbi:MAG: polyprenyl synthetase family protein [Calditrichaeota bacterium]|nr:MAG: polyprenyl synthetase family protein [Calditrichota bacterium]
MEQKINTFLQDIKSVVDAEVNKALHHDETLTDGLYKAAEYSAAGGKRVRAVFTILVGRLFGVKEDILYKTATAVEMIHAASLIMDDLPYMDDSQLRRGKPANHVVFGQDVALCASIAMLSHALELVLNDEALDTAQRNHAARVLTRAFGFDGLAAGQFVDLKLKTKNVDYAIIEFINAKKTAALFTAAGEAAAAIGGAGEKELNAIVRYSENIGFAFQIIDDLLDASGSKTVVGKDTAHDKMNFVMLVGKDKAYEEAQKHTDEALRALEIFGDKNTELKALSAFLLKRVH